MGHLSHTFVPNSVIKFSKIVTTQHPYRKLLVNKA